jgi:tetratricopeptide (TPR) repeat protein
MHEAHMRMLHLAMHRPNEAIDEASRRSASTNDPAERSLLHRVKGNAFREMRQIDASRRHLELGVAEARRSGDPLVEGHAVGSLASTLSYTGELDQAVRLADRCVELLGGSGPHRAEALLQRAKVLRRVGRTHDALADLTAGVLALDQADDPTMEGDLRGNRGVLLGFRGQLAEAITETERALEVFQAAGWTKRVADMSHNLAWLAGRRGDLVESLRLFDETEVAYGEIGMSGAAIFPDRCEVLIAAGLEAEAQERRVVTPLHLGDGPVVLSPSSGLQATPWGVVPALAGRSLVVVPSATSWCRAETRRVGDVGAARPDRGVVLVAGPDLHCAVAEVEAISAHRRDADRLTGATATVANVAKAMAGAGLVHLACHGTFARNNPMFSSLLLHDGPLFVYDIERLVAAPEIVVLPSCHGGLAVRRPAGQMLGTLASLLAIGTRTVVAAALPVPDRTDTVAAMALLHERLAAGDGPARALAAVRRTTPLLGGAFNCAGTG